MAQMVTKEMNIADALELDPGISKILFAHGMHCLGCMMASGESLEDAALVHGANADALVAKINEMLAAKQQA